MAKYCTRGRLAITVRNGLDINKNEGYLPAAISSSKAPPNCSSIHNGQGLDVSIVIPVESSVAKIYDPSPFWIYGTSVCNIQPRHCNCPAFGSDDQSA